MFHAVADIPVWKQIQEVVFLNRKAAKMRHLSARERHVVGHEAIQVAGQGVMDPNVNIQALLSEAVVPEFGRGHPRTVHEVLNVARLHARRTFVQVPRHGHCEGPSAFLLGIQIEVGKNHIRTQVLSFEVKHEAVDWIDVEEVGFNAC